MHLVFGASVSLDLYARVVPVTSLFNGINWAFLSESFSGVFIKFLMHLPLIVLGILMSVLDQLID